MNDKDHLVGQLTSWRVKGTTSLHLSGWASNIPRRWENCVCETESTWRIIQRIIKWPSHSEWIWEVFRILLFGIRIFRHVLHVITVLIKLVPFAVHKAGTIPITDVKEVKWVPCIVQSRPECLWGGRRGIFERQGVLLEARGAAGDMCCALIKPLEVMHLQPKKVYLVWLKIIVPSIMINDRKNSAKSWSQTTRVMAWLQEENQSEITSKMLWHILNFWIYLLVLNKLKQGKCHGHFAFGAFGIVRTNPSIRALFPIHPTSHLQMRRWRRRCLVIKFILWWKLSGEKHLVIMLSTDKRSDPL